MINSAELSPSHVTVRYPNSPSGNAIKITWHGNYIDLEQEKDGLTQKITIECEAIPELNEILEYYRTRQDIEVWRKDRYQLQNPGTGTPTPLPL